MTVGEGISDGFRLVGIVEEVVNPLAETIGGGTKDDGELVLPFFRQYLLAIGSPCEELLKQFGAGKGTDVYKVSFAVAVLGDAWPFAEEGMFDSREWLSCGELQEFHPRTDGVVFCTKVIGAK